MSEQMLDRKRGTPRGNLGVHAGAVVLIVCFLLPWVTLGEYSALDAAIHRQRALATLMNLGIITGLDHAGKPPVDPLDMTRVLWVVPLLALSTLVVELTIPPGHHARGTARVCILAGGGTLCAMLAALGLRYGSLLAYGFWWSLSGALLISVGGTFDVLRRE